MYGYVMLVASSLPIAPRKNASRGSTLPRLFSTASFNFSKMVYCKMGLITNISAGSTPAKRAVSPSSRSKEIRVPSVLGFRDGLGFKELLGRVEVDSVDRAVILVLITQIGFVMSTVALPARAPAIIDSIVVSFDDARRDRRAAREKRSRVHSYPVHRNQGQRFSFSQEFQLREQPTIVVDKVGHANSKQGRV